MSAPADASASLQPIVYVLVPPSPLFAAHWSLFIPDILGASTRGILESDMGRRMHVSGDRLNGFKLEIIRGYNIRQHRSVGSRRFAIGRVSTLHSSQPDASDARASTTEFSETKDEDEGGGTVDNVPRDAFEEVCVSVEAPGPSLNSAGSLPPGRVKKAEVKDCQWWVKAVVKELVVRGILAELAEDDCSVVRTPEQIAAALLVH